MNGQTLTPSYESGNVVGVCGWLGIDIAFERKSVGSAMSRITQKGLTWIRSNDHNSNPGSQKNLVYGLKEYLYCCNE